MKKIFLFFFIFAVGCQFVVSSDSTSSEESESSTSVAEITGTPSEGASDIYAAADLNDLCVDAEICGAPYDEISAGFLQTTGLGGCEFDFDPNDQSAFVLHRQTVAINGLKLLLSKEDLFFLAWVSIRFKINPHFLLGVMAAESRGNCAAVSSSHGEGCFQITNTFGQAQLNQSYPGRVSDWHWSDRSGSYYPDAIFIDEKTWFGEVPASDQFRMRLDPTDRTDPSDPTDIINFNFGVIASGLYFQWQQYYLYHHTTYRAAAEKLFQSQSGKSLWQAATYNGGIGRSTKALLAKGNDFLEDMRAETRDYAPTVVDYCTEFEAGASAYQADYSVDDVEYVIDLLAMTYPASAGIDWNEVKDDVRQVFFGDGTEALTFESDIKALVYVISTHVPELAPEWAVSGSL